MSCGATGCNARGAPRVGVPRRDESVATGDGALCDASTGPATRTAQRVGRGRVGGVHSHMNTQPPGSTPSPIASLPLSRASALGLHDPSRAPASALHGTIWAPTDRRRGHGGSRQGGALPHAPPCAESQCTAGATLGATRVAGPRKPRRRPTHRPTPPSRPSSRWCALQLACCCADSGGAPGCKKGRPGTRATSRPSGRPLDPPTPPRKRARSSFGCGGSSP